MLYGMWADDLRRRLQEEVGSTRAAVFKFADVSHNLLLSICDSLAQSYVRAPIITNPAPAEALIGHDGALARAGYFALMSRVERDLYALREMLINVSVSPGGELVLRPVSPDNVIARADHNVPDRPVEIAELRLRHIEGRGQVWCYDVYSIGGVPVYRVVGAGGDTSGKDLTFEALGVPPMIGEAYPFRDGEGDPVLPYVFYHAQKTGHLFDAYAFSDLVDGTQSLGAMYSMLTHVVRAASWPQRVSVGLQVAGLNTALDGRASEIVTDPASLLQMTTIEGFEGQGFLHQFNAGGDPSAIMDTISRYERGLVAAAGVPAADFQRISGDPKSGYAISLTREGLREMQRRVQPQLEGDGFNGDTGLFRLCAIMLNRHAESVGESLGLPEDGYAITYQGVPETKEEKEAQRRGVIELLDAGLMSPVQAYQELNPGTTEEEAAAELAAIRGEPAAVEAEGTPAAVAEAESAAPDDDVLNGAQVTAAQGIVTAVAVGDLPRTSGVAMLVEFFGITEQAADRIMGDVGRGFVAASVKSNEEQ